METEQISLSVDDEGLSQYHHTSAALLVRDIVTTSTLHVSPLTVSVCI